MQASDAPGRRRGKWRGSWSMRSSSERPCDTGKTFTNKTSPTPQKPRSSLLDRQSRAV